MTHIRNIPHILRYGITYKNSPNANPNYITIGDLSLIKMRAEKHINISNGNRSQSRGNIILGDFIPFYFGIRMPMLYVMQNGGNFVEKATPPQDIVYLVCQVQDIVQSGVVYYFSDGHAINFFTLFYDSLKISDLPVIIDWDAIQAPYWGGMDNLDIKRKKQAEFLIAGDIPAQYLYRYAVYNEAAKKKLILMGIESDKIKIVTNAYY